MFRRRLELLREGRLVDRTTQPRNVIGACFDTNSEVCLHDAWRQVDAFRRRLELLREGRLVEAMGIAVGGGGATARAAGKITAEDDGGPGAHPEP